MTSTLDTLVQRVKQHPDSHTAGMILCHNGIVRGHARDGRKVRGLRVHVDENRLTRVVKSHKQRPGIVDIQVEIRSGVDLEIGDDVMWLVVAGDVRENVLQTMTDLLNEIKTHVTRKTEDFRI